MRSLAPAGPKKDASCRIRAAGKYTPRARSLIVPFALMRPFSRLRIGIAAVVRIRMPVTSIQSPSQVARRVGYRQAAQFARTFRRP